MEREERKGRWQSVWTEGHYTNWHLEEKNPELWKFLHLLNPDPNDKSGIFLIPMCGKCLDLKFLYEEGFNVLGVEFCEDVIKTFFEENKLSFDEEQFSENVKIFATPDKRLRIACGDVLEMTKEVVGEEAVKMVWDRGGFGSIEKENRKPYVKVIKSLLRGCKVKYLLDCWQYQDWYSSRAPNNCPFEMICQLFEDEFDINELQRIEKPDKAIYRGAPTADKVAYLMTSKDV